MTVSFDLPIDIQVTSRRCCLSIGGVNISQMTYKVELPDSVYSMPYVSLSKVYTARAYRGLGYMTRLLDYVFGYVKETLGLSTIILVVNRGNTAALALYRKTGFCFLMDHEDTDYYIMIKKL